MYTALSVVVGVFFACSGIAYKVADRGKVLPMQAATFLSLLALPVFALLAGNQWSTLSWQVAAFGACFGLTQYLGVRLLRLALALGPLSPAWCARSLSFVPVILYAGLRLHEPISAWQCGTVLATVGAILASASTFKGGGRAGTCIQRILYGGVLTAILLSCGVLYLGLKFCSVYHLPGQTVSLVTQSGNLLMFFTYFFIGAASALDLTLCRNWRWNRYAWTGGLMLAFSAICAYTLTLAIVGRTSAVTLFAVSNATSILGAGLASVCFFQEKRSTGWLLTIIFALLAILLNR